MCRSAPTHLIFDLSNEMEQEHPPHTSSSRTVSIVRLRPADSSDVLQLAMHAEHFK